MKFIFKAIPRLTLATFFFFSFFSSSVFAWNALGHMLVASVAYQQLTPSAKNKADYLVSFLHQEYPEMASFNHIAYWPDAIRGQKIETYTHWHYIDVAFSNDGTPLKNLIDTDNAVWALKAIENVVGNDKANPNERARFLSFLVHITADLHQPLHTVSLISASHPDGDKGGNAYRVHYAKEMNGTINLHKLWDTGVGEFTANQTQENVAAISATISALYPVSAFSTKQLQDLNPETWAQEGLENAKQYVYSIPENGTVTTEYIEVGKRVSEREIALAGYRLAALLNQLLG